MRKWAHRARSMDEATVAQQATSRSTSRLHANHKTESKSAARATRSEPGQSATSLTLKKASVITLKAADVQEPRKDPRKL